ERPPHESAASGNLLVAVDQLGGESGYADGDVIGAAGAGGAVLDPFAGVDQDSLAGVDVDALGFGCDAEHAAQHQRIFVEFGSLAGLDPASRTLHLGDTYTGGGGVDPTDELADDLRLVAGGFDDARRGNQGWHSRQDSRTSGRLRRTSPVERSRRDRRVSGAATGSRRGCQRPSGWRRSRE